MTLIHNNHPIEQSFRTWINQYPESYHPLDLKRFYSFVKCVCRYSRKEKGAVWLRQKLSTIRHNLSEEDMEYYCDKFVELQTFYKAPVLRIYEAR